ncbi:MAG TPA: RNA polymerase sigma-70 factor [Capillimicrobium sp.]|nr:RNA polymerase sigma-70 factor [Capillimicrobium sp.]
MSSPTATRAEPAGETYDHLRRLMFAIAYRMTGGVSDAEDIVQEAFLRLERARREGTEIASPKAWLSAVTTRLAIDHLRSARVRHEQYVGPWLPEPVVAADDPGPAERAELADSLSQAFLVVLETLSPVERAVFLLHDVFGYDYPQVAAAVGRREDNCRQIAARARRHVDARRPRFDPDERLREELFERFLAAAQRGETEELKALLADDAVLYSDGGGRAVAARRPILGADRVARFMVGVTRKRLERAVTRERRATVNGQPGRLLFLPDGRLWDVLAVDVVDGRIAAVRIVRNPDKLRHLEGAA